jgi:hypothetical protein
MPSNFLIEYNLRGGGPRLNTWGDKQLHVIFYNIVNGRRRFVNAAIVEPGHFTQMNRQWATNWETEAHEWVDGKLVLCFKDTYTPYGKTVHFYLDDTSSIDEHRQYLKACKDFIIANNSDYHLIESYYANELIMEFPDLNIVSLIDPNENCYVNFEIKKSLSERLTYENYGVVLNNEEVVNFCFDHPFNPEDLTPYEFARSIVLGPNFEEMDDFIPYAWTLAEGVVS